MLTQQRTAYDVILPYQNLVKFWVWKRGNKKNLPNRIIKLEESEIYVHQIEEDAACSGPSEAAQ